MDPNKTKENDETPVAEEKSSKTKADKKQLSKATAEQPVISNPTTDLEELKKLFGLKATLNRNAPKSEYELEKKEQWKFWETQPVPALGSSIPKHVNEPMEPNKDISEINPNPFSLPAGFKWNDLDLENTDELMELYTLLNENYVEDDDNMFRFDYSPEFLKW